MEIDEDLGGWHKGLNSNIRCIEIRGLTDEIIERFDVE